MQTNSSGGGYFFLCLGLCVHLLLLYAIFDIYYSSPIVIGARSFPVVTSNASTPAPADRLVFFSADGLRTRAFYDHPDRAPFLHGLIRDGKAAWGISNSHVPTESRPGHVALMAGFYEDVSAVTHGWKHNPVPFDSSLNQSARAFLWGSPDIVHLFSTNIPHAYAEVYAPELEDFASKDASKLDQWVFQRVEAFFQRAQEEPQVQRQLATRRAIFFLHLIGLDTNGHGHKPRSENYLANIGTVDEGCRQITHLFQRHFGDNRTAFLFTADHGMTDWGSHGDGTDDEVQTPFVAWGAGIEPNRRLPVGQKQQQHFLQLAQVDMAPLQAALLGTAIPANSFGIVPVELLQVSAKYRFQAAYANFKQMAEQFALRRAERRAHSFRFFFTECPTLRFDALVQIETEILRLAQLKRYEAAWKACLKWVPLIREALNYFHGYHRFSQGLAIGALFCAWNFVLYASFVGKYQHLSLQNIYAPSPPLFIALIFTAMLVWAQGLTAPNYLYFLSPLILFSIGLNMLDFDISSKKYIPMAWDNWEQRFQATSNIRNRRELLAIGIRLAAVILLAVLALSLLVMVFFERSILTLIFVAIYPFWFLFTRDPGIKLPLCWLLLCLLLAIFPLLDTVGNSPHPFAVILAELLCCLTIWAYRWRQSQLNNEASAGFYGLRIVHWFHWAALALLLVDEFLGSNPLMRVFAWISLPAAFALPIWPHHHHQPPLADRLLLWSFSVQLPYSLLSLGHECLFLCCFSALLFCHVQLLTRTGASYQFLGPMSRKGGNVEEKEEQNGRHNSSEHGILNGIQEEDSVHAKKMNFGTPNFTLVEWLNALFLVVCIEMAFFGTGNIASLNSFNPSFLRHFVSVFSPFTMASLLLLKIFIPFLLVALHFVAGGQNNGRQQNQQQLARLSTLVALHTNTMAMAFFYCLRTDGSWLQIGISISNYVICLVCSAATYLLLHLAHWLLFGGIPSGRKRIRRLQL